MFENLESKEAELIASADAQDVKDTLVGIKGWLILFAIGICTAPVYEFIAFILQIQILTMSTLDWSVFPGLYAIMILSALIELGIFIVFIYIATLFFRKKKKMIKWWIGVHTFAIAMTFIIPFLYWICTIDYVNYSQSFIKFFEHERPVNFAQIIVTGIWILYLLKSKCVKATFTK